MSTIFHPGATERDDAVHPAPVERELAALVAHHVAHAAWVLDAAGCIAWANAAFARLTGFGVDEARGRPAASLLEGPETDAATVARMREAMRAHEPWAGELVLYRRSGRPLWVELSLAPAADAAGAARFVATGRDVTARRLAERRTQQLEAAVEGSLDGIAIVDAFHDLRYVNDAFATLHGHVRTAPMLGTSWRALYDEAELARFDVDVLPHLDVGDRWRGESIARRIDGSTFPLELSITSLARGSFVCVVRDITERRESEEALRRVSFEDALTGLWNRRGFLMLAQQALTAARRSGGSAHLLYLDLDSFKPINDTHGHAVGDEALVEVADLLRATFRESDLIGRLGGDEFVVLATNCVDGSGEVLLRRLDEHLAERNAREGRRYRLAISRGVARFDAGAPVSLDELMLEADRRLYEEKRGKRAARA